MFEWMAWTTPVAVFFCCIALMLVAMTVWELKAPTVLRGPAAVRSVATMASASVGRPAVVSEQRRVGRVMTGVAAQHHDLRR